MAGEGPRSAARGVAAKCVAGEVPMEELRTLVVGVLLGNAARHAGFSRDPRSVGTTRQLDELDWDSGGRMSRSL